MYALILLPTAFLLLGLVVGYNAGVASAHHVENMAAADRRAKRNAKHKADRAEGEE